MLKLMLSHNEILDTTMATSSLGTSFDIACLPDDLSCSLPSLSNWTLAETTNIWNSTTNRTLDTNTVRMDREFNDLGDPCSMFRFILNAIVIGLVCILGIVGNTVSMFVLQRDRHNQVAVFLLQSLAVADNLNLCLCFFFVSILYGFLPTINPDVMKNALLYIVMYGNMVGYAAQSGVIWVTVLLGVNRYVAICVPYQAKRWLTLKAARIQVALVAVVSVLLNVPRLFQHTIDTSVKNGETVSHLNFTAFGRNRSFSMIYLNIFYTSVILILPLILLVIFNACIIRQLQRSKKRMIRDSLSYSGKQENNITIVMVIIVLELVLCHTPDRIIQIIRAVHYGDQVIPHCPEPIFYAYNISNLIVILSSSTDFIIYYVFRERFRTILCERLCSVHHGGRPPISLLTDRQSMIEPVLESPGQTPDENFDDHCPALSNV